MSHIREIQLRQALFRGHTLHLENAEYLRAVRAFSSELLAGDVGCGDLTVKALCWTPAHAQGNGCVTAQVLAKSPGIAAGIAEFSWLVTQGGVRVQARKRDGEPLAPGETLLDIEGPRAALLLYERIGLNILQRMSGIATTTRNVQDRISATSPHTFLVGTRKTPWGLLDKRALHLGGGGTHRLGLWDAILVKNNHLALLASREEDAVGIAAQRAWACREAAAFIEIEVRSHNSAVAAAQAFRTLREAERDPQLAPHRASGPIAPAPPQAPPGAPPDAQLEVAPEPRRSCPCVLMFDNIAPAEVKRILGTLRAQHLLDYVLIEASGNISETNVQAYAESGVDAISVGALTHSVRALDLSLRIS